MRISSIYDQGTAENIQDAWFTDPSSVVGVADCHSGASEPFLPGQEIRSILLHHLTVLERTNEKILEHQKDVPIGHRAGAVFALAKIYGNFVKIIQGGDAIATWQLRSGEIGFTSNNYESFDIRAVANFARLIKEHHGSKEKVLLKHQQFLADIRQKFANNPDGGYAVLNGDPRVQDCWFTIEIPKKDLATLLFFTDGLVAGLPKYTDHKLLLKKLTRTSREQGLQALVDWARGHQEKTLKNTHINFPEISVVHVTF